MPKRVTARSEKTRKMVISAVLGAITALFTFTPIGMITLPPPLPSMTLVHIPVIVAAVVEGPVVGAGVGLVFGLCSLIRSWETGMVGLTLFFRNPLISVIPRILVPLAVCLVMWLVNRYAKGKGTRTIGMAAAGIAGSLTNTVLVLGSICLIYGRELTELVNNMVSAGSAEASYISNAGAWLVAVVGVPNGLMEAAAAAVFVPAVCTAVAAVKRRSR